MYIQHTKLKSHTLKRIIMLAILFFSLGLIFSFSLANDREDGGPFLPELLQKEATSSFYQAEYRQAWNKYGHLLSGYLDSDRYEKALTFLPDYLFLSLKLNDRSLAVNKMVDRLLNPFIIERLPEGSTALAEALKSYGIYLVLRQKGERGYTTLAYLQKNYPDYSRDWQVAFYQALALDEQITENDTVGHKKELIFQAIAKLKDTIELNPEFTAAYQKMAELYQKQGEIGLARDYYWKALRKDGSLVELYLPLADIYRETGDYERAYSYYRRIAPYYRSEGQSLQDKIAALVKEHPELDDQPTDVSPPPRTSFTTKLKNPVSYPQARDSRLLRIGLATKANRVVFKSLTPFKIFDQKDRLVLSGGRPGEIWSIERMGNKLIISNGEEERSFTNIERLKISGSDIPSFLIFDLPQDEGYYWGRRGDAQFRGNLEIINKEDGLTLINLVHLEEYLLSVVPGEMPALWPLEAVKAQAVAARSYTLLNLGKHRSEGFDLCSGVHCASYKGNAWEHPRSSQAVLETTGEVLQYGGQIIDAVYNSNSGGLTEDSEDVWQSSLPYLRGTSTLIEDKELPLEPADFVTWIKERPLSYSSVGGYGSPVNYRWTRFFPAAILEARLNIGPIIQLLPLKRSTGGYIQEMKVVGERGEITIRKNQIRSLFMGLRSNKFIVESIGKTGQPKAAFILYGAGWGHGVGLDQTAAAGMGENGFTYLDILQKFYQGAEVKKEGSNQQ